MEGDGNGQPTCWACEEAPRVSEHGLRLLWRHYRDEDVVDKARKAWSKRTPLRSDRGRVKDGMEWKLRIKAYARGAIACYKKSQGGKSKRRGMKKTWCRAANARFIV